MFITLVILVISLLAGYVAARAHEAQKPKEMRNTGLLLSIFMLNICLLVILGNIMKLVEIVSRLPR